MVNKILKTKQLEELLQQNWGNFLDHLLLMRMVLEHVRDTTFKEIKQPSIPDRHVKITVTKFSILQNQEQLSYYDFEIWIEFTIPKDDGVVIGTSVCFLNLIGNFYFKESYGTFFRPENS